LWFIKVFMIKAISLIPPFRLHTKKGAVG